MRFGYFRNHNHNSLTLLYYHVEILQGSHLQLDKIFDPHWVPLHESVDGAPLMHSSSPKSESRVVALIRATHFWLPFFLLGLSLNLSIFQLWLDDDLGNLEGGQIGGQ